MQVIASGSFINLENQEKTEQLIFTEKEMGRANETDGFVNEPENNKRLALEIWQSAEYMTRDHEEAQIGLKPEREKELLRLWREKH